MLPSSHRAARCRIRVKSVLTSTPDAVPALTRGQSAMVKHRRNLATAHRTVEFCKRNATGFRRSTRHAPIPRRHGAGTKINARGDTVDHAFDRLRRHGKRFVVCSRSPVIARWWTLGASERLATAAVTVTGPSGSQCQERPAGHLRGGCPPTRAAMLRRGTRARGAGPNE